MSFASLNGRNVVITGGGRGLGKVMALALVDAGANVTITGARSQDELTATRAEALALQKGGCECVLADVADPAACTRTIDIARAAFGEVDVVINNAAQSPAQVFPGKTYVDKPRFWTAEPEAYAQLLLTNIAGPFFLTQRVVEGMIARGFGRIINISTSRPTMVFEPSGPYGPAKAALETSSVMWARQLAGTGVTVNVLLPGGPCDTALNPGGAIGERAVPWRPELGPKPEGSFDGLLPPEVMVAPALWLASDESAKVTGRRLIGRNWDPALPPELAFDAAVSPVIDWPHIM